MIREKGTGTGQEMRSLGDQPFSSTTSGNFVIRKMAVQESHPMSASLDSILAAIRFLAWLFPATPLEKVTTLSPEELRAKYNRRYLWGNFFGLMAFVALVTGYYFLLNHLANWYYHDLSSAKFLIRPHPVEFAVLAAFISLISSTYISLNFFWWLFFGPKEYAVFSSYVSHRAHPATPYDILKVSKWMFWLGFPPLAVLAVLLCDNYTAFTNKAIIDNPFWSLGTQVEHPYTAVQGVYEVRGYHARFQDVQAPYQLIEFADHTRWETPHGSGGPKLEHQREIMGFVAKQSGQKMHEVDFAENIQR